MGQRLRSEGIRQIGETFATGQLFLRWGTLDAPTDTGPAGETGVVRKHIGDLKRLIEPTLAKSGFVQRNGYEHIRQRRTRAKPIARQQFGEDLAMTQSSVGLENGDQSVKGPVVTDPRIQMGSWEAMGATLQTDGPHVWCLLIIFDAVW
ncbi:MAG: hypothetical protein CNE99_00995 [OM182 bacterium MED-G24]|uniref:Uncharacterized protein n=1 Tax=OM182 bacterium MED-G24 TaxID=1986255 RepID=A0A2A5X027_9GAMM|nr:MAG: hypothetical protein CNE99_00995 [OM182 bacterium MED-G24]